MGAVPAPNDQRPRIRATLPAQQRPVAATSAACVLAPMALRQLIQCGAVERGGVHGRDAARRYGDQARGAARPFEVRPLAEHRTRPVFGEPLAVLFDQQHPVEEQEYLVARIALANQCVSRLDLADRRLLARGHDLCRETPLKRRLDRRDHRVGVLVTPGRVPPERLAKPVLEISEARFV